MEQERLLISGCLLGLACRYDGKEKPLPKELLDRLKERYALIPVCPEQLGGLSTPRPPAEARGDGWFLADGSSVTEPYRRGAEEVCKLARLLGVKKALLKEKSPACGHGQIYDGSFQKRLTAGDGAAAKALLQEGIALWGETRAEELL